MKDPELDEALERIQLMAQGDPQWDLSDNDCKALTKTLMEIIHLRERIHQLEHPTWYGSEKRGEEPAIAAGDIRTLLDLAKWCRTAADGRCCKPCDEGWLERARVLESVTAPREPQGTDFKAAVAAEQAEICAECGERRDSAKHIRYGPDLDNPRKHEFERIPAAEPASAGSGTQACLLCEKAEPHRHPELTEKGLPMALAISSVHSLHSVAAILGKMREDYETAARASAAPVRVGAEQIVGDYIRANPYAEIRLGNVEDLYRRIARALADAPKGTSLEPSGGQHGN